MSVNFDIGAQVTPLDLPRRPLRLPGTKSAALSLFKEISLNKMREGSRLEFRVEAFNVLNSFRAGMIVTDLSSAQFGRIRQAQDPRIMQFALKYIF